MNTERQLSPRPFLSTHHQVPWGPSANFGTSTALESSAMIRPCSSSFSGIRYEAVEQGRIIARSEEHTSELQSRGHLVCRLLLEKKKKLPYIQNTVALIIM